MSVVAPALLDALGAIGFALALVSVHEYGHLFVGRMLGVPAGAIRVDLGGRPPHTALHDGERWLSPDDPGYAGSFSRHRPGPRAAWMYVGGGIAVETTVAALAVVVLVAIGADEVGIVLAWTTLSLTIAYLGADVVISLRRGRAYGDHAVLWQLHRGATCLLLAVASALKFGAVVVSST